jgi:RNA polymerase sigma-70 factor (ECF subfamily)
MTSLATRSEDEVEFDLLFRRYWSELNVFAYRRLRDREAAADVVQDGFMRFLSWKTDSLEQSYSPRLFLWRVVANLTVDLGRQKRRRGEATPIDDVSWQLVDPAPSPEMRLEAQQQLDLVRRALDELTYEQRTSLLLNRVEGLTHAEIADRLGVSASMVAKHVSAAFYHCIKRVPLHRP